MEIIYLGNCISCTRMLNFITKGARRFMINLGCGLCTIAVTYEPIQLLFFYWKGLE